MARVADGFGTAGLASLLLHGGAALVILAGLPKPSAPPPQVIEMAFLPAPAAETPAIETPATETAATETPAAEIPNAAPAAEPVAEAVAPAASEPFPEADALMEPPAALASQAPAEPEPAPTPAEPMEAAAAEPQPPTPPRPAPAPARPRLAARGPRLAGTATAPAAGPAAPAPVAVAAAPPAPPRAVPQSYIAALFAALDRRKEYPETARWRRAEGIAILRVLLRRDGSVQAWRIERGTGHEDLDHAVGNMVRRASPLPAPPAEVPGDPVEFSIPVRFSLR